MKIVSTSPPPGGPAAAPIADRLETAFLAEMLKHISPSPGGPFSGGAGEQQFGSWLTEARAEKLAARLDLGLGDRIGGRHG